MSRSVLNICYFDLFFFFQRIFLNDIFSKSKGFLQRVQIGHCYVNHVSWSSVVWLKGGRLDRKYNSNVVVKIQSIGSGTRPRIEGLHRRIARKRMHTQSGCIVPGGDFLISKLVRVFFLCYCHLDNQVSSGIFYPLLRTRNSSHPDDYKKLWSNIQGFEQRLFQRICCMVWERGKFECSFEKYAKFSWAKALM